MWYKILYRWFILGWQADFIRLINWLGVLYLDFADFLPVSTIPGSPGVPLNRPASENSGQPGAQAAVRCN
jgi:hypothetical protein